MLSGCFTLPFPPSTPYPISGLGRAMFCIHCRALCKQTHWPLCSQYSFMDSQREINIFFTYAVLTYKNRQMIATFPKGGFISAANFESYLVDWHYLDTLSNYPISEVPDFSLFTS